ncbi:MAG: hypothetical protein ACFFBH_16260 [Promethearchaeota archaeon]
MKLKRPRCDNCGKKIYPKSNPFIRSSFLFGKIPSYCPDCGKEISNEKKAQLDEYSTSIYAIWCLGFITFVVITIITIISLRSA